MRESITVSKIDKKKKQTIKKNTKKNCSCFISFGQISQNEST